MPNYPAHFPRASRCPPAMETEVCASGPKKRRLAPSPAPAPVATDAARSVPMAEESPCGTDRISQLPDAILSDIVSLLPTKQGARTQTLASRWRHIWRAAPLNIDSRGLPTISFNLDSVLLRILAAHPGPARHVFIRADHRCSEATVEAWLRSPALDNLQEFHFRHDPECQPFKISWQPPPPSTFRFSPTLRVASIGRCRIPDSTAQALRFPQLKQLALQRVCISEHSLHSLIASCPVLECLLIHYSMGFSCLRVNSLSLRSIGVLVGWRWSDEPHFKQLLIENVPRLERLLRLNLLDGLHVSVISAPKLDTLGWLSIADYQYSTVIQGLRADSLMSSVHTLKVLALDMSPLDLDKVIELMRCFPCLEKLYIYNKSRFGCGSRPGNFWRRKHQNLHINLKKIVLQSYCGIKAEVNFAKFFVLNARALQVMTFHIEANDAEFIAKQLAMLKLGDRASRGARFHFTTDRCIRDISKNIHVSDLDLVDPFIS